jgi:hypothetical protein
VTGALWCGVKEIILELSTRVFLGTAEAQRLLPGSCRSWGGHCNSKFWTDGLDGEEENVGPVQWWQGSLGGRNYSSFSAGAFAACGVTVWNVFPFSLHMVNYLICLSLNVPPLAGLCWHPV